MSNRTPLKCCNSWLDYVLHVTSMSHDEFNKTGLPLTGEMFNLARQELAELRATEKAAIEFCKHNKHLVIKERLK